MRPIGYMDKQVSQSPSWLAAASFVDVYSLSGCVSPNFPDYINYWRHNGYWLFDSPAVIRDLADEYLISTANMKLFYYEAHDLEFDGPSGEWLPFEADPSFETNIEPTTKPKLEGFDVTTFSMRNSPKCSPLSCNRSASEIVSNSHCLFPRFEDAIIALEQGVLTNSELGPFRIITVYSIDDA